MPDNGHVVDTRTIVDNGDPARRFDIVILGDGFRQSQLALFDTKAKGLADRLLAMSPFDQVAHLINVHTVRTVSTDSGISAFPGPNVVKNTFYRVRGHFPIPGLADPPKSFLGTTAPDIVLDAARLIAPSKSLDLYIVLANVKALAASAFPDQKMAFTGLHDTDAELANYTAHECGHVIAGTAEEYLDCDGPTPGKTYPNQATEAERLAGTVWWKSLAKPSELDASGGFRAVHLYGDPDVHFTATMGTPKFDTKPSLNNMLGLFWGCQDVDPGPPSCEMHEDPRGRHYYRAMAACRMRNVKSPFCRVCSDLMLDQILSRVS